MRKTAILAALAALALAQLPVQLLRSQVAPGANADAIHPAGPPDPQKLDAVWQVDPISDQVTINIPFTTTPQGGRGPKLPFALLYNSASTVTLQAYGSYVVAGATSTIYDWSTQPISGSSVAPSGPWTTTGPYIYGSVSNYPSPGCNIDGPFIYVDQNGSAHDMNLIGLPGVSPPGSGLTGECATAYSWVYTGSGQPTSFSTASSTPSSTSDGSSITTSYGVAIDPDGTSATGNFTDGAFTTPSTPTLTDSNGNPATLSVSSGVYTAKDALGRTVYTTNIPIGSAGQIPAGTYSLTTNNESGTAETYSITFSQEQIGTFNMPHPTASDIGADVAVNSPGPGNSYNKFTAVTKVELPDSTSYQFAYDPTYGTISMITFPTGGYVRFCWGIRDRDWNPYGMISAISSIVVTDAFTSTGGTPGGCDPPTVGSNENQWAYAMESLDNSSVPIGQVTAPDGTYTQYAGTCSWDFTAVSLFGGKESCAETSRAIYGSGGNLKMSVAQNLLYPGVPLQVATALYDGPSPLRQLVNYKYDGYNNVVEKDESDYIPWSGTPLWAIPSSLPWIRSTYTQYAYNATATEQGNSLLNSALATKHIANKPAQVIVTNGSPLVPSALTYYLYDSNGNLTYDHKCISISGSGSSASCASSWTTQYQYDLTGQLTCEIDGPGLGTNRVGSCSVAGLSTTLYQWGNQNGIGNNGFLLSVTHANGATDQYTYFAYTGEVKTHVDWNSNTTSYDYTDSLNRIKSITLPATTDGTTGSLVQGLTTYNYTDTTGDFSVQEKHLITGTTYTSVTRYYDGLGRLVTSNTQVPTSQCSTGAILLQTAYDSKSRVASVSNPYCSPSDPTYGKTQFEYDALDRKIQATLPDGSVSTTAYGGNATETTDPPNGTTSVQHIQQVNGLGQLTNVCEVTGGSLGSGSPSLCGLNIEGSGYLSTYAYDPLGDLLSVNQHGLSRSFTYDGLSRLLTSLNPEVGLDTYTYPSPSTHCAADEAVPCTRQDAREVVTNYGYDNMSRLIGKSYTAAAGNTTGTLSDLSSCYQYDTPIFSDFNPMGQLTAEWQQATCPASKQSSVPSGAVGARVLSNHDAMNRVQSDIQCLTASGCSSSVSVGNFVYSYNLIGDPVQSNNGIETTTVPATELDHTNSTSIAAPSVTWRTTYDLANHIAGVAVQDQPSVFSTTTYLADPTLLNPTNYDPFGHMTVASVGAPYGSTSTALNISRQYDPRGRLVNETDGGKVDTSSATVSLGVIALGGVESGHYFGTYPSGCLTYDTGTIKVTISNDVASASWGSTDTAETMSTKLASAINTAAGAVVTATPDANNASYIDLFSTNPGAATDYSVSVAVTDTATTIYPQYLANPSFSADAENLVGGSSADSTYGTIYSYNAGYAPNGNILTHADSVMGRWNFTYDAVDRLVTSQNTAAGASPFPYTGMYGCWTYDAYGNRISEAMSATPCASNPPLQSWANYNSANNQMTSTSYAPGGVTYDAAGNVLKDGLNEYWFDAEGRLCAAQSQVTPGLPITQYIYDAESARIGKQTISAAPSSTGTCAAPLTGSYTLQARYLVDHGGDQVTEMSEQGSETWAHSNIWAGSRLTATYSATYNTNGGLFFELADPLGSRRILADVNGNVKQSCQNLPYGDGESCQTTPTEHLFTGKERDTESGLDYFPMRYYGSAMGRWMSPDPLGGNVANPQSLNRYEYVFNNPLRFTDSTGLQTDPDATCGWLRCGLWPAIKKFFSGGGDGGGCTGTCVALNPLPPPTPPLNPHSTHTFHFLPVVHAQEEDPNEEAAPEMVNGAALEPLEPGEVVTPEPYSYMNPGPLREGNAARAFAGGQYWKYTVPQGGMTVYRAWTRPGSEGGPWFSPFPMASGYQSIIDNALRPEWGNSAENVNAVTLPAGTVTYWGISAYQGDFYLGGSIQIYAPPNP
jgi:RHS repeat-associated protein